MSDDEPKQLQVKGITISCPICHHDTFWTGRAQLNTALATFFKFDWANKEATTLTCDHCSHIMWFDLTDTATE